MSDKTISISFKIDDAGNGFKNLIANVKDFESVMTGAADQVKGTMSEIANMSQLSMGFDSVAKGLSDIQSVIDDLASSYAVQQEAETKLAVVMQERMNATEENIQAIKDLCSAQQELGVIGDEVQLAGAQQLSTFLSQQSALETLIPAMNNLVAQQKGLNATSSDTVSIANLLGKAMHGQTSALRRVGITFTEAEEAALKMGTEEERAAMIAQIITNNVGNMNAALAKTASGGMKQLENKMGDVKEMLGKYVGTIAPIVAAANQMVIAIGNIGKVRAAIVAVTASMRGLTTATGFATLAVKALDLAFKTTIVGAVIGAALWAITKAMDAFSNSTEEAAGNVDDLKDSLTDQETELGRLQAELQANIVMTANFTGSKEDEKKIVDDLNTTYGETMGYYETVSDWYKVLIKNSEDYCRQLLIEDRIKRVKDSMAEHTKAMNDIMYDENGNKRKYNPKKNPLMIVNGESKSEIEVAQENYNFHRGQLKDLSENLASAFSDADKNLAKMKGNYTSTKPRTTSKPSKSNTAQKPDTTPPPPPPEGSIADYEKKIQEIEQKIKITVDDNELLDLTKEKQSLEVVLTEMRETIRKNLQEALKKENFFKEIEKMPGPSLKLDLEIDPEGMDQSFKKAVAKVNAFNKTLKKPEGVTVQLIDNMKGIQAVAEATSSAFKGMGDAFDLPELNVAGTIAGAIANMIGAYATAQSQAATLGPWGWIAFALTGLATLTSVVASVKNMAKFADGGIAYGPAIGLFGEYAGAAHNPEVVAPLDKLKGMLADEGGANINLRATVSGDQIILATANATRTRTRNGRSGGINI